MKTSSHQPLQQLWLQFYQFEQSKNIKSALIEIDHNILQMNVNYKNRKYEYKWTASKEYNKDIELLKKFIQTVVLSIYGT